MFAEMKNKIREKSGGDLPKLPSPAVVLRGKHSRQSSGSSISSLMQDSTREDKANLADCNGTKSDASGSESSLSKLKQIRSEDSTTNGIDEREKQWRIKEQGYVDDLLKQTRELQAALKKIEDYESKFNALSEEKEQVENFQTQEMAKVKHLLLAKENENSVHLALMKENEELMESLKAEVSRLRPFEEKVSSLENAVASDKAEIVERLNEATQKHATLEEQIRTLEASNTELRAEIKVFKETLIRERRATEETKRTLTQVGAEKDEALMRNAEMSMKAQLAEKSLKMLRQENDELIAQVKTYETVLKKDEEKSSEDDKSSSSNEVNSKLVDLENQLIEKNKTIRVLQQRMSDLKKMLQKEVVNSSETNCIPRPNLDEDINLKYLKHVVIKFLTCRDYEAQHLTRAVATLLRMSADEERVLRETVDWRMSWFKTRPQLPPSQR